MEVLKGGSKFKDTNKKVTKVYFEIAHEKDYDYSF